ncbi:hypothetical protein ACHWQZ_G018040 [Mnemiopsis leidyi]
MSREEQTDDYQMVEDGYLSEQFVKRLTGDFDLSCVIHVHAKNTGIENLGCVYMCENLVSLDVSYNKVHDLSPLFKLQSLQILDLSNNKLSSLKGLEYMPALSSLNVSGNELASLESLKLLETIPNLRKVIMKDGNVGNPVCHLDSYPNKLKALLPDLVMLDYRYLKGELSSAFKSLDEIDASLREEKIPIHDIPQSGPVVSPSFWEEEFFDDLDLNMKLRYLKETLNSVYVEKYRMEDMMTVLETEGTQALQRLAAQLKGSPPSQDKPPST